MIRTSAAGLAQLVAEEGEALNAYRDVAGVWTIGVGLTAASGVVRPRAGLRITRIESRRLLAEALASRYEPAVATAMPGATQAAFDGGVSFHFNTGAIARADWVAAWRRGERAAVRAGLLAWTRAGGREREGLRRRRMREAELILDGRYAADGWAGPPDRALRRGSAGEGVAALQAQLIGLGLLAAPADGRFGAATEAALRAFQSAHPRLVVDGIAGPATRAQLARVVLARRRATASAAVAGASGAGAAAVPVLPEAVRHVLLLPAAIAAAVLAGAVAIALWRYRDELVALVHLKGKH